MLKSASEIFLSGLRGAKKFSNAFRIVFRILLRVFQTAFRIDLKVFLGAVSFCTRAALMILARKYHVTWWMLLADSTFCKTLHRLVRGGTHLYTLWWYVKHGSPRPSLKCRCRHLSPNLEFLLVFVSEEDKRATTNVQNGLVFFSYSLWLSFRLFELKQ